jgi:hypothetical protein
LYVSHYCDWSFDNNPHCETPAANKESGRVRDYCGPRQFTAIADKLYRSQHDGTFRDVTDELELDQKQRALGVIAADLDGDRDTDIYVANDVDPNLLIRNEGAFHFSEIGRRSGVACNDSGVNEGSMGIAVGDFNLDGKLDLWVTNFQNELGALYRNNGNLGFTYVSNSTRIVATDEGAVGWGTAFCDLDCDGDEDLINVNGHIELYPVGASYEQAPQVLENMNGKYFRLRRRASSGFLDTPQCGRGLAMGDFNRDGLVDFVVGRVNAPVGVIKNTSKPRGRFLNLRLVGVQSNRDAIGATAYLDIQGRRFIRTMVGGGSYASTHDQALHFGIPESLAEQSGTLTIAWPSGLDQSIVVTSRDSQMLVVEGQ